MYLKKEKCLIVGVSKSGFSVCCFLLERGAKCFVYDDAETDEVKSAERDLSERGATVVYKSEINELLGEITMVVPPSMSAGIW